MWLGIWLTTVLTEMLANKMMTPSLIMVIVMFTKIFNTATKGARLQPTIQYNARHQPWKPNIKILSNLHITVLWFGWRRVWLTESLGRDATLGTWISYPVIVLERVHSLKHCRYTPHSRVDLCVSQELSGQVWVEACLDGSRSVDPQCWVEEHMVQKLPCQEWEAEQLHLNWCASPLSTVITILQAS